MNLEVIGVSPMGVKYDETILEVGLVALIGVSTVTLSDAECEPEVDCANGGRGGSTSSPSLVVSWDSCEGVVSELELLL